MTVRFGDAATAGRVRAPVRCERCTDVCARAAVRLGAATSTQDDDAQRRRERAAFALLDACVHGNNRAFGLSVVARRMGAAEGLSRARKCIHAAQR